MAIPRIDAHCDTLGRPRALRHNTKTHLDLDRLCAFAPSAQFFAIFAPPGKDTPAAYHTERLRAERMLRQNADICRLATSAEEVRAAADDGKVAVLLSVEGAALLNCSVVNLLDAYKEGVRLVNLTWNKDNILAGAAMDSGSGLTKDGVRFVKAMWNLGMGVDLSHSSEQTFWDVMEIAERPVLCSHSNAKALCDHKRNLTDDQIRAVIANKGVIGLNFCTNFLGGDEDVNAVLAHVEHFLSLGAGKTLCLGGDLDGIEKMPEGMTGVESMPALYEAMLAMGLSEELVQDIFWNNLMDYMERAF